LRVVIYWSDSDQYSDSICSHVLVFNVLLVYFCYQFNRFGDVAKMWRALVMELIMLIKLAKYYKIKLLQMTTHNIKRDNLTNLPNIPIRWTCNTIYRCYVQRYHSSWSQAKSRYCFVPITQGMEDESPLKWYFWLLLLCSKHLNLNYLVWIILKV